MLPHGIRPQPARGAHAPAPVSRRNGIRYLSLLTLLTLTLALGLRIAPVHACTGSDGTRSGIRSVPTLRAAPVLGAEGIAAFKSEPTLVILCMFSDRDSTTNRLNWDAPMFGPYIIGGRSQRDYYREVSYYVPGLQGLDLPPAAETCPPDNDGIAGWYSLSWTDPGTGLNYTTHPDKAVGGNWENTSVSQGIAAAAIAAADADVNFAAFDQPPQDGNITAAELHVIIILAGYEDTYAGAGVPATSRHHWSVPGGVVTQDGVTILWGGQGGGYSMVGELDASGSMTEYGLICHEMGHDLGLPDLYDTTKPSPNSEGIGEWGLMGSGDWCNTATLGDCPVHLDPWCKSWLGWLNPIVVGPGDWLNANIPQVETNQIVYKLWSQGNPANEFFLVENRQRVGYDRGLVRKEAADGLVIWHVNYTREAWGNRDETLKFIDVECADGQAGHIVDADHLDAMTNRGCSKDPWYQGTDTDFYTSSSPDNRDYRGPNNFNTSVEVRNISASGNPMTADLKVGKSTYIGSKTFTANGQNGQFGMLAAANSMRVYYLGWNCCGNTDVYEQNNLGQWVLVNTWDYNVPRHDSFVSGQEVRQQAGQWTGIFRLTSYSLCGTGCDDALDAGYDVDVYDNGAGGGSSPGNGLVYPGWGIGFRDGLSAEFGSIGGTNWTFSPDALGLALTQFPRRAGLSGVQSQLLIFQELPNVHWERMRLQFTVTDVMRPGPLTITCPYAQYPTRMVSVTGPGYYEVELGWVHPPGPYPTSVEMVLSTGSSPSGADFAWDWLNFGTLVAPIDLVTPSDGLVTSNNRPPFDWTDLYSATSYQLQADQHADFLTPDISTTTTSSTYTPSSPLGDGYYYWRARGSTTFGGWSDWTGPWRLRIDTQPPQYAGTTIWPDTSFSGPYPVRSTVWDTGSRVDSVSLFYRFNGAGWTRQTMAASGSVDSVYNGVIAAAQLGDVIDYYLSGCDFAGNVATDPVGAPGSYYTFQRRLVGVEPGLNPRAVVLMQNQPNPFVRSTAIRYGLPKECVVSLDVYDTHGRRIRTLASGRQTPGYWTVSWDGRGESGQRVSSGIYFYRLKAGEIVLKRRMLLVH